MFKKLQYLQTTDAGNGYNNYVYQVIDTDFTTHIRIANKSRAHIVVKLIDIYASKKQNIPYNIALYYLNQFGGRADATEHIIIQDAALMELRNGKQYAQYYKCIKNHIAAYIWARRLR